MVSMEPQLRLRGSSVWPSSENQSFIKALTMRISTSKVACSRCMFFSGTEVVFGKLRYGRWLKIDAVPRLPHAVCENTRFFSQGVNGSRWAHVAGNSPHFNLLLIILELSGSLAIPRGTALRNTGV